MTILKLRFMFLVSSFIADQTGNMFIYDYAISLAEDIDVKLSEEGINEPTKRKIWKNSYSNRKFSR